MCAGVLGAFVSELRRSLSWRAKRALSLASVAHAETATITFVQRFDSGLRLNVHFHVLALDGVYVRDASGAPVFHALPAPTEDEVSEVARRTAERVEKLLVRRGRSLDPEQEGGDDPLEAEPALSGCASAAARGVSSPKICWPVCVRWCRRHAGISSGFMAPCPRTLLSDPSLNGLVADPDAPIAAAAKDGAKSRLRQNTEQAIELGVFGSPTFAVGGELFWGNDRLEQALEWEQTHQTSANSFDPTGSLEGKG
jgi:hypothetical protein